MEPGELIMQEGQKSNFQCLTLSVKNSYRADSICYRGNSGETRSVRHNPTEQEYNPNKAVLMKYLWKWQNLNYRFVQLLCIVQKNNTL